MALHLPYLEFQLWTSSRRPKESSSESSTKAKNESFRHHRRQLGTHDPIQYMESAKAEPRSSPSIPITNYIPKTLSEIELSQDEAVAEYKDFCMYSRIVDGISRQQLRIEHSLDLRYQNNETLANIIRTRHDPSLSCSPHSAEEWIEYLHDYEFDHKEVTIEEESPDWGLGFDEVFQLEI